MAIVVEIWGCLQTAFTHHGPGVWAASAPASQATVLPSAIGRRLVSSLLTVDSFSRLIVSSGGPTLARPGHRAIDMRPAKSDFVSLGGGGRTAY